MTGENVRHALAGVENVLTNVGKTDLADVFQKSDPHILLEKTTEIFRIKRDDCRGILQRNRLAVMRIHIIRNGDQTGTFRIVRAAALL